MRRVIVSVAVVLALFAFTYGLQAAEEDKEVTLKGTITCAKCDLKIVEGACATVIKVTEGEGDDKKDVIYWFNTASHKKHHSAVCQEAKPGEVVGTVTKDGEKLIIAVKELKYDE